MNFGAKVLLFCGLCKKYNGQMILTNTLIYWRLAVLQNGQIQSCCS